MPTERMIFLSMALTWRLSASPCMAQTYTLDDLGTIAGNSVSTGYALSDTAYATGTSSTPTAAIAVWATVATRDHSGRLPGNGVS